jgi:hypothetical protein
MDPLPLLTIYIDYRVVLDRGNVEVIKKYGLTEGIHNIK